MYFDNLFEYCFFFLVELGVHKLYLIPIVLLYVMNDDKTNIIFCLFGTKS